MPLVEPLLAILAAMLEQLAPLTKRALDIAREEEVCRQLMSVPGVGPITGLAFRATIGRPDRFRRSRDVDAHLGLTPARYQSGETDIQGRVDRCGDEFTPAALYESCPHAARAQPQVVEPAGLGNADRQAPRHGAHPRGGSAKTCRRSAPHVG